jgi:integrase
LQRELLQTRKGAAGKQRQRLTEDAYRAIWKVAAPWLRNAMDLSLLTLLRREDIVSLRFADVRDGALWVVPGKTEGTTGVRLKIAVAGDLADVLARCRDDVLSPFLIHRFPEKARPQRLRARECEHHTQVLPEQLSRAFADAREQAGVGGEDPPTFHEIRSLGGALLREQQTCTVAQVQALMAHSDAAMTAHYLGGHERPWTEIAPALRLRR